MDVEISRVQNSPEMEMRDGTCVLCAFLSEELRIMSMKFVFVMLKRVADMEFQICFKEIPGKLDQMTCFWERRNSLGLSLKMKLR